MGSWCDLDVREKKTIHCSPKPSVYRDSNNDPQGNNNNNSNIFLESLAYYLKSIFGHGLRTTLLCTVFYHPNTFASNTRKMVPKGTLDHNKYRVTILVFITTCLHFLTVSDQICFTHFPKNVLIPISSFTFYEHTNLDRGQNNKVSAWIAAVYLMRSTSTQTDSRMSPVIRILTSATFFIIGHFTFFKNPILYRIVTGSVRNWSTRSC